MTTIAYLAALIAVLTIALITIGLPILAVLIGCAIGSHFGPEYFGWDDWDVHPPC